MRHLVLLLLAAAGLCLSVAAVAAQESSGPEAFEVDALNPGLPPAPDMLDRETPQSSVEAFLFAAARRDWDRAAQILDLSYVPEAEQATTGPELAEKLFVVIDRKVPFSWQSLLERPDALDVRTSENDPAAAMPRKSLLLGILDLDGRPVAIRLNRVKPGEADPVWVFSAQTVDNVESLFLQHGPTRFERWLPDWMRLKGPFGMRVWEWIAVPVLILGAILLGTLVWRWIGWISGQAPIRLGNKIIRALRLPATVAAVTAFVGWTTSHVFVLSGVLSSIVNPLIVLGFVVAAMALLVTVIDVILDHLTPADISDLSAAEDESKRSRFTTLAAIRRLSLVVVVVLGAGLVLLQAKVFQVIGVSFLASAGALVFVLGFAAREIIGNILASMQISLNRSARVGDALMYKGEWVTVERIHFTFVQLRVWNGARLIVPVLKFVSEEFTNMNLVDSAIVRVIRLRLSNRTDMDEVRRLLETAAGEREHIDTEDDMFGILIVDQDETGMELRIQLPTPDASTGWIEECWMRERLLSDLARLEGQQEDDLVPHLGLSPNPDATRAIRTGAQVNAEEDAA